jgi:hypothetical protein
MAGDTMREVRERMGLLPVAPQALSSPDQSGLRS